MSPLVRRLILICNNASAWLSRACSLVLKTLFTFLVGFGFVSVVFAQSTAHLRGTNTGGGATTPVYPATTGGYVIHTFTSNGTFTPPPGVTAVDVLIVGGGGGGGRGDGNTAGGGGGGGEMRALTATSVTPGNAVAITVGTGGAGRTGTAGAGTSGNASSFGALTAIGGGGGGAGATTAAAANGVSGGSGGGGGSGDSNGENGAGAASTATSAQGAGGTGNGRNNSGQRAGGGGGGAALGAGGNGGAASNSQGGAGGPGRANAYSGASVTYAGGGGGGATTGGAGGTGGGGAGGNVGAVSGTVNTGGGGGGAKAGTAGAGASGIVIVRYLPPLMSFQQQPSTSVFSGSALAQQPQVLITAADGVTPLAGIQVSVTDGGGAPTVSGTLTATTNGSGIAAFTDLVLTGTGTDTLIFTVAGAASNQIVSNTITVTAPLQDLAVNQQPSATGQSGIAFATPVIILANDGNNVQGLEVTATIASGGDINSSLSNATATTNANGLAEFTSLTINGIADSYVLEFTAPAWGAVSANAISIQEPLLQMNQQPSASVDPGIAFAQQPRILVENIYGVPVQNVTVTASIATGDPGAVLGGTLTAVSNASGLAQFTDLAITGPAGNYTLAFSADTWTSVTSTTVAVQAADPLAVQTQPSGVAQSGVALAVQPVILANDGSNVAGLDVTVTLVPDTSASLSGTTQVTTLASGLAAFTDLVITGDPGNYVLRFAAPGWESVDSQTVTVTIPDLVVNTQPSSPEFSGVVFGTQPVILVQDVYNNPVQNATVTAAIATGPGTLGGTVTAVSDASGLASFANLQITGAGDHTLLFSATGWGNVTSNTVTILAPPSSCSFQGGVVGSQIVQLLGCTEVQVTGGTAVNLPVPVATVSGDLLIAAFSSPGNGVTVTAPAGWTNITQAGHGGGNPGSRQNLSIWTRVAGGSEPATYNFTTSQAVDTYAYMTRYGGASGTVLTATVSVSSGTNATAPALTTAVDDSLIVRFAAVNGAGSMTVNPATIITGHRNITQNVVGDAWGAAAYFNQETAGNTGTANFTNSNVNWVTQTIAIEPTPLVNYFQITHASAYGLCADSTPITITVYDALGNVDPNFQGVVTISNSGNTGDYTLNTGTGTFDNGAADDGTATYEFTGVHSGVAILDFSDDTVSPALTFDANSGLVGTLNYALSMNVGNCTFTLAHTGQAGVCAAAEITISVLGPDSAVVTGYSGQVTINSAPGTGNWSNIFGGSGTLDNGTVGDGEATYTFSPGPTGDGGTVALGYSNLATGNYTFTVTAPDVASTSSNSGTLTIGACTFRIIHDGSSSVCRVKEITIQVVYDNGALVTGYNGTVNLSTAGVTGGNWSKTPVPTDANGTLTPGAVNTGAATYQFVTADGGEIILDFQDGTAETVNFNLVAANVVAPSGQYDPDLIIGNCTFRITHSGTSDVCSIEAVTIAVFDSESVAVTDYAGSVNLSTSTSFGTWVDINQSDGTLTDPVDEDGSATYQFVSTDLGVITLGFRHSSNTGPVNLNVTDGVSFDPQNSANQYDQNLVVSLCTFEISHSLNSNACEITPVTFTVRNSVGGIATDYIGTMRITNNTNRGDWFESATSQGVLIAPSGADTGVADYTFDIADNGVVILEFSSSTPAIINFDVEDSLIVESGSFDPNLFFSGCFPQAFEGPVCTNPGASTSISIPDENPVASLRSRMVLMATMQIGDSSAATTATYNGVPMTRVVRMENDDQAPIVTTEIWAIFDADLPNAAGSYTGTFSGGAGSPAICLLSVTGVEQQAPVPASPNPATGPVNSSKYTGPVVNGRHNATTLITTSTNNAFVFSVAANDRGSNFSLDEYFWRPPQPSTTLTGIWGGRVPATPNDPPYREAVLQANPTGGKTAGSSGVLSAASVLEVTEPFQSADILPPTMNAHVVAAFNPLVGGAPLAEGYVPVLLYETYSGAMSYRAIGNSLRTNPSPANLTVDPNVDCSMVNFATGTTADLAIPVGATITAAYLYWAGSGTSAQADSQVSFGPDGNEVAVVANNIFMAEGLTAVEADFFAGYAEVSSLISGSGTYRLKDLTVQTGAPWNNNGTCAGGWSLIVVYEHPDEHLRVVNLFHGFQPFQYSSFTLVPRNFRMATYDAGLLLPNGQVTHVTIEGDEQLSTGDESLGIQTAPDAVTFAGLPNSFNPPNSEFNSTVTRPLYDIGLTNYFEFQSTSGLNGDGYEIDFPGPDADADTRTGNRIGATWGIDIDTHYLSHTTLQNFAQPGLEAERITTRYSSGQDLVILLSEVVSISNFPIADLEVFIQQSGTFKVNGTGSYQIDVTNNGNGANTGGGATGIVTAAVRLPAGLTFASSGAVSGTGWSCSVTLSPGAFTCNYDIANTYAGGVLAPGDNLPAITANVQVGDTVQFPLLNNNAPVTARILHSGGNCNPEADGYIPDPLGCDRSPQFDNKNDTQGDTIDVDTLLTKTDSNNNVDQVISVVRGIETNLRMQKSVVDTLETDTTGQYLLTVTNLGPDATTRTITVTDAQPSGVQFTAAAGTGWNCSSVTPTLTCTYAASLGVGVSTTITLDVSVVGAAGFNVTNTAQVSIAAGNFDTVAGNNSATDITTIVGPPVASQERFLLSVSTPLNSTSIGGLSNFENHDLIIYDPSTDEAVMFFDDSVDNGGRIADINATHLMKNGHIIISANGNSLIGSNDLEFDAWDLVRYDPIVGTASMFLAGSTIFAGHTTVNVNGAYVLDDCSSNNDDLTCSVLLTTTTGGVAGTNNLAFTASDIIIYYRSGLNAGEAAIYLDGSDAGVFGGTEGAGNVNVDAFYLRVDPNDPEGVIDTIALSVDNATAIIGEGLDPITGTLFSRDDVTELAQTAAETQNLFVGDQPLGVFEPASGDRRLDALHLVEDGYIGHFSIKQEQSGSVCEPGVIRISKHEGLTHNRDLDYFGSVRISTDTNYGTWQLQSGNGVLTDQGNGNALYNFVAADQGTVVLRLVYDQPATVHVDVTNGIARELGSEDATFTYNSVLTPITWIDEFNLAAFSNNDGSRNWVGSWNELDGVDGTVGGGLGVSTGNIQVQTGRLRMTSSLAAVNNSIEPSVSRVFNIDAVPNTEDVTLTYKYAHTALAASDTIVVEARGSSAGAWVPVTSMSNMTSDQQNSSIQAPTYNLSTILGAAIPTQTLGSTAEIRFRIDNGFELDRYFYVDRVVVQTATDQCGYTGTGTLEHYAITHSGYGLTCVGTPITITAHDAAHDPISAEGESITLSTSPAKGVWSRVINGIGSLTSVAAQSDNGLATYTFAPGEQSVTLLLNYTVPAGSSQQVNINVLGSVSNATDLEDQTLEVAETGLRFFNETLSDGSISTQIAGKPSNVLPLSQILTIQGVRSSDNNPYQCVPLFDAGQSLNIGLAAECKDAAGCFGGETFTVNGEAVAVVNDNAGAGAATYTDVELDFVTQPSGAPGATIVLNYSDVGQMQLHGRFNIPFGFFGAPSPDNPLAPPGSSGDFMLGSSPDFVVRPFGFAIDFPGGQGLDRADAFPLNNFPDRAGNTADSVAVDDTGNVFVYAGEGFDTAVSAVAWQAGDDTDQDGQPDIGANLHDNPRTPNFYNDTSGQADGYRIKLSVVENQVEALGGVRGILSNGTLFFNDFDSYAVAGTGLVNLSYNEVGIIDLQAQLVDVNEDPVTYLGTDVINGRVDNVGRFYPERFEVIATMLLSRSDLSCAQPSTFTYMDEPFEVEIELRARNVQGQPTVNYRNVFAKLASVTDLNIRAIEEVVNADNTNRTTRLTNDTVPVNFQNLWSALTGGELALRGDLIFNRAMPADPDGPYEDIVIAFVPIDSDGVTLDAGVLDAEITEATPEFLKIGREDFRYGRLIINNAYGPATEDLAITFRVEYYDSDQQRFVLNAADSCTPINANQLSFVADTYTSDLTIGDTMIVTPQPSTFYQGEVQGVQSAVSPTDQTFTLTAPGEDNSGTVDIQLDLDALSLPYLRFKWPHEDNDYDEFPRAQVEFGQFRSHDRVIYWQEIYNGATP